MAGATSWDELLSVAAAAMERMSADLDEVEQRRADELSGQLAVARAIARSQRLEPREREAASRAARATQARLDGMRRAVAARRETVAAAAADVAALLATGRRGDS
jgi:hypothetical protein